MKMPDLKIVQEKLSRLSKTERTILYIAVAIVSLAIIERLIINPIASRITSLNDQIRATETNIRKNARILSLKDRILAESAKYSSYAKSSASDEEEMTAFLKEIEQIANRSSVYLIDVKPSGIKNMGSSKKFSVVLNCEGEMDQLAAFMVAIESANKLMSVEKYQITPKSKDSAIAKCAMAITKMQVP